MPITPAPRCPQYARFDFIHELERDGDLFEVEVGYNVSPYRAASYGSPAEGGEIDIIYVTRDGVPFDATGDERDELYEQAEANAFDDMQDEAADYGDYRYDMARDAMELGL